MLVTLCWSSVDRFLLRYATRDTVCVLDKGYGGVSEVRSAVGKYEEKSPLYGLVQYRRKKIVLKYVPEGTSRLLQGNIILLAATNRNWRADSTAGRSIPIHSRHLHASRYCIFLHYSRWALRVYFRTVHNETATYWICHVFLLIAKTAQAKRDHWDCRRECFCHIHGFSIEKNRENLCRETSGWKYGILAGECSESERTDE